MNVKDLSAKLAEIARDHGSPLNVVIVNGDGNELEIDEVIYSNDQHCVELRSEDS